MTQAATQITLSLADRVRGWSRQERDLAMAIRGLQVASCPSPASSLVPPPHFAPSMPLLSSLVVKVPFWTGPDGEEASAPWVEPESEVAAPHATAPLRTSLPSSRRSCSPRSCLCSPGRTGRAHPSHDRRRASWAGSTRGPPGPFDEFIAALTMLPAPPAPIPPGFPTRPLHGPGGTVGQPHRAHEAELRLLRGAQRQAGCPGHRTAGDTRATRFRHADHRDHGLLPPRSWIRSP